MLDTQFERPPGDAGNCDSYTIPARTSIISGAGSPDIVKDGRPSGNLISAFITAAKELEAQGACALTSTCGFLITIQERITAELSIPVLLSALGMYEGIATHYPNGKIGILTASKSSLGETALKAANIDPSNVIIMGMEDCPAFANTYLRTKDQQTIKLDQPGIKKAILHKAETMLEQNPDIAAFLLECGNLPPYQQAIAITTGKPVFSILDGVNNMISRAQKNS